MKLVTYKLYNSEPEHVIVHCQSQIVDIVRMHSSKLESLEISAHSVDIMDTRYSSSTSPLVLLNRLCSLYGVTPNDLRDRVRTTRIVQMRKAIVYRLRNEFKLSYKEIGNLLDRDHSTIILNYRSAKREITDGEGVVYDLIMKKLNEG